MIGNVQRTKVLLQTSCSPDLQIRAWKYFRASQKACRVACHRSLSSHGPIFRQDYLAALQQALDGNGNGLFESVKGSLEATSGMSDEECYKQYLHDVECPILFAGSLAASIGFVLFLD